MSAGWEGDSSRVFRSQGRSAVPVQFWFGVGANDHAWQNEIPGESEHFHLPEDRVRVLDRDTGRDALGARRLG